MKISLSHKFWVLIQFKKYWISLHSSFLNQAIAYANDNKISLCNFCYFRVQNVKQGLNANWPDIKRNVNVLLITLITVAVGTAMHTTVYPAHARFLIMLSVACGAGQGTWWWRMVVISVNVTRSIHTSIARLVWVIIKGLIVA